MTNTKIRRKNYISEEMAPLDELNRKMLSIAILGYGKTKYVCTKTNLSPQTLKRAIAGFRMNEETKNRIIKFLSDEQSINH